ncbi:MAG: aldo/keto reductase [Candidatus Handelsmanbacteria bacterium]|nr:aldo/keto reductase [Candidatus Handelsmanbacteria bacterium]
MAELQRRRLGKTGMTPRALGLGCAFFGSANVSDAEAVEGIRRAIELGLDYLDTSPLYSESERRVGLALEGGWRERIYLQTKTGTHPEKRHDFSAATTRWSVENSLRLLKTDYLDAVLIHDPPDIEIPLAPGAALDELLKMKDEGLIGHLGVGVRQHQFHRRAIETGQIEIVLSYLDYTLLDQSVAATTLPLARDKGVGIILASALGMGRLAGPEPDRQAEPIAHAMWVWCRQRGVDIRHLALQYVLAAPIEGIAMSGPCSRQQVEEVYQAATAEVPAEVWREFRAEFGVGL